VGDRGDGAHGRHHQPDRQQGDHARVGPQLPWREGERLLEQQRGQEQHQDQLGRQLGRRRPGHEPQHQAAQHQHDRIRHADRAGQDAQCPDGQHEHQEQQLSLTHAITSPTPGNQAGTSPPRHPPLGRHRSRIPDRLVFDKLIQAGVRLRLPA
jgi:hypothetical protein